MTSRTLDRDTTEKPLPWSGFSDFLTRIDRALAPVLGCGLKARRLPLG
jgi:hypothetical protein